MYAQINFIRENRYILPTHTADEANLDWETQIQDSVNVSLLT